MQEFVDRVLEAKASAQPLLISGAGTKAFLGETSTAKNVLSTLTHRGIVNYEPTELVITARAGTPLSELEKTLAQSNQMLGFEPGHFGAGATVGGAVATGLSGPRRAWAGACRDFVLGANVIDAQGQVLRFGGEVMKNVAGYDVSRLLCGSFGTLALLTEVSLKVLPVPAANLSIVLEMDQAEALKQLNQWGGQPLPITASSWFDGQLVLRLEGANAAVAAARARLGGQLLPGAEAAKFWLGLREQTHAFFAQAAALWRVSIPSITAPLELGAPQWIEWGGAQRWVAASTLDAAGASALRASVAQVGGHATLFRLASNIQDQGVSRMHPLGAALAGLHKRMKQQLDPQGIFSPGRYFREL